MAVGLPTEVAEVDRLRRRRSALFSWRHAFQGLVDSEFVVLLLEWVELLLQIDLVPEKHSIQIIATYGSDKPFHKRV